MPMHRRTFAAEASILEDVVRWDKDCIGIISLQFMTQPAAVFTFWTPNHF